MSKRKRSEQERRSDSQWLALLNAIPAKVHRDALCKIIEYLDAPALLNVSLLKHEGWTAPIEATLPRVFRAHFPLLSVDKDELLHAHTVHTD
jgi:hypothetical protein